VQSVEDATEHALFKFTFDPKKPKKMRYVTTAQEAALFSAEMHSTDEIRHNVKLKM